MIFLPINNFFLISKLSDLFFAFKSSLLAESNISFDELEIVSAIIANSLLILGSLLNY